MFMVLAAIGLVKFPDLPTRMHAATKSGVLAVCLIMAAVGLYFYQTVITARVIAIITFILITAPLAAHAIGRAAYFAGVPLWQGTAKDELEEYYSLEGNTDSLERNIDSLERNTDSLERNTDSLERNIDSLERNIDSLEQDLVDSPKENKNE
ncbi:MAG: multicomponent Na+:H+ antiporter subunit G [Cellvibrionaceae bacterium]|jgi:multicomponent Na+:H+ antiporter subunit G